MFAHCAYNNKLSLTSYLWVMDIYTINAYTDENGPILRGLQANNI